MKDTMKILIMFYSRDGHTRKTAEMIANALKADMDQIIDKKSRKGLLGFLRAGYDATRGKPTDITFTKDADEYDLIIIGTPVWNGRITPAVRTYLTKNKGKIKKCAFFVTCAGRAGKCLNQMHNLCDGKVIAEKVFFKKNVAKEVKTFVKELERVINSN